MENPHNLVQIYQCGFPCRFLQVCYKKFLQKIWYIWMYHRWGLSANYAALCNGSIFQLQASTSSTSLANRSAERIQQTHSCEYGVFMRETLPPCPHPSDRWLTVHTCIHSILSVTTERGRERRGVFPSWIQQAHDTTCSNPQLQARPTMQSQA